MPIVPAPQKQPADIRQLPSVGGFTISADDMGVRGWGALADASQSLGRSVDEIARSHRRARELKDAEDARKAETDYLDFMDRTLNGTVEDGVARGGLLSLTGADAARAAADWESASRAWLDRPDGPLAGKTAAQRQAFVDRIAPHAMRARSRMVQHSLQQVEAQRKADAGADLIVRQNVAQHLYRNPQEFKQAADEYAEAAARQATYGTWRDGPNGELLHQSPETFAAYQVEKTKAREQIEVNRALYLASEGMARPLDDPEAPRLIAEAAEMAKNMDLTPVARQRIADSVKQALGRRETLEREALEEETRAALDSLVREKEYDPAGHPRREQALENAHILFAGQKQKQEMAAATARGRQAANDSRFLAASLESGVVIGADGKPKVLSTDDAMAAARGALKDGHLLFTDYTRIADKLEARAVGEDKAAYEQASIEVGEALGETIKTVWGHYGTALANDAEPDKVVYDYKYRYRDTSRGKPRWRDEKRKIVQRDVPKLIDLLVRAKNLDGVPLDLDGNPDTPDERFDYGRYRARLVADLKARVLTVDIDQQARAIAEASLQRQRQDALGEALAIRAARDRATGQSLYQGGGVEYEGDEDESGEDDNDR